MRGELLVRLNIDTSPIANKYREGKLQRTLERELKGRETVWKETDSAVLMSTAFRLNGRLCVRVLSLPALDGSTALADGPRSTLFWHAVSLGCEALALRRRVTYARMYTCLRWDMRRPSVIMLKSGLWSGRP